jgi:hypothetical protein
MLTAAPRDRHTNSYSFKDGGECDERRCFSRWEAIGAFCDRGVAESCVEEGNVGGFVAGDLFQVVVEVSANAALMQSAWVKLARPSR